MLLNVSSVTLDSRKLMCNVSGVESWAVGLCWGFESVADGGRFLSGCWAILKATGVPTIRWLDCGLPFNCQKLNLRLFE